jgi:CheY-like chemotaxis protein/HPt (histidine-containing phosphotransfer) domain-containing protein
VFDEMRRRFVDTFVAQCDSLRILVETVGAFGSRGPVGALTQLTHRLSGLAGTIGFPTVSARALELEALLDEAGGAFDADRGRSLVDAIEKAFTRDLSSPPVGSSPAVSTRAGLDGRRARTVVIADDDPEVARLVDAQMRSSGYTAIVVSDGEQALAVVRAHPPDVLVLDLMMPKVSGFDVLTEVRASRGPRPRIIVLSGRGREQDVLRAFELGADDYMTKPFSPQELLARMERFLR